MRQFLVDAFDTILWVRHILMGFVLTIVVMDIATIGLYFLQPEVYAPSWFWGAMAHDVFLAGVFLTGFFGLTFVNELKAEQ